ncbi:MAG: TetR/AcrR family transcriptional regulator [Chloroflexi bacterium]|nr:TetR/AcrR family transcriptional regulator [Chloroflexota bacterium]
MARKTAADYHDKAGAILDAAARVFSERGYERATMTEVARAAGFSKASAYHYFESKEAVLRALLARSLDELTRAVAEADPGPDAAPRVRLARLLEAYLHAFVTRISVVTPLLLGLDRLRPEWRDEIQAKERRLLHMIAGAAEAAGSPVHPTVTALLLLGAANWTHYWYDPEGEVAPEELARQAADLLTGWSR